MADITLSSAVRNNLLSLQNTANLLGKTQERLATGLKVNSALDDPTAFFTASSLNSRASDLNRLLDSVGNAVQTIKAADEGIKAITKLLESAQATARQAQQSSATTAVATGTVAVTATTTLASLSLVVGDTLTANGTTHTVAAGQDVDDVLATLNGNANLNASVSGGRLRIEEETGADLVIAGTGGPAAFGLTAGTIDGSINDKREDLAVEFDALRTQIDQLSADASFNGINLLQGDNLEVVFNETGTSTLNISGVTFNSAGLSVGASSLDFQTDGSIGAALDDLTAAINTLRSQSSTFGSNLSVVETRQDFTNNLINVLETGAGNLTLADTNEEGANLLALQTRQQLSSVALSLASQADQNVLRLF